MKLFLILIALFAAQPVLAEQVNVPPNTKPGPKPLEIKKELESGNGESPETAYVIYARDEGTGVAKE